MIRLPKKDRENGELKIAPRASAGPAAGTMLRAGGSLTLWGPEACGRVSQGHTATEGADLSKAGCFVDVTDAELGLSCV